MKSKFLRVLLAVAATYTFSALAQTGSAATPSNSGAAPALPSAPSAASATTATGIPGTKVGTINIQDAIFGSNEGQRDMQALQKKYEPKQNELKNQNDELEALKKQLDTQGPKLNEDAQATLKQQIESKQKLFDRAVQDAQEEVGSQQQDVATRILKKMAPMIVKYAQDNGFALIVDTSKTWPQSPVLWWNADQIDITKPVVDAYNVQSGVAAPAPPAGAKPTTPAKPATGTGAGTTPKPSVPSAPTPQKQ
jgi:Skp family chaperone for outer membrane proteins